ncbi:hypothetical protein EJ05DRAFT_361192 [Pseudovirgaria hyperparasitica]|uniref:Uncharacterized protein n=1 Tax=Pseudovirgaria hyperparasitica TaxID=470096 RepID=A0A6A6W9W7_9PEZI|nr:uncharacterized protein EJ05DRAFT_361192 [Pseudovirgaria hyperparasitica]KAF2758676.1 hypothetical protein EJ05DRAFT_361192 [Pseudovirgaria hyperparasitica]
MKTFVLAAALGSTLVAANGGIPESAFHDDDGHGIGHQAAVAAAPMWHFGRPHGANSCYPQAAEENGVQTKGNGPDVGDWGRLDDGCADPGPWKSPSEAGQNPGNYFPTYYETVQCNDGTYRTTYSIYFRHDSGHTNDWEHIAVVWVRNDDGTWRRDRLLLGQHKGHQTVSWGDVQNTVNGIDDQFDQGAKDRDHAKVYVGSFRHAIFHTRKTTFDTLAVADQDEFRSWDWYYLPLELAKGDLIDPSWSYGDADTTPPSLRPGEAKDICTK